MADVSARIGVTQHCRYYIEMLCSPQRRHSPAAGLSPVEFELRHSQRLTSASENQDDSIEGAGKSPLRRPLHASKGDPHSPPHKAA